MGPTVDPHLSSFSFCFEAEEALFETLGEAEAAASAGLWFWLAFATSLGVFSGELPLL